jgi:hypothetical protein
MDLPESIDDLKPENWPETKRRLALLLENVEEIDAALYAEVKAILELKPTPPGAERG